MKRVGLFGLITVLVWAWSLWAQQASVGTTTESFVDHAGSSAAGQFAAWGFNCPSTYSVFDYGARGDGVADDTAAIQAALNAAAGSQGCVLFGSGHTFLISGTLTIPGGLKMTPVAGGAASTIRMSPLVPNRTRMFTINPGATDILINGLLLDESGKGGILIIAPDPTDSPPERIVVQNCVFRNTGSYAWANDFKDSAPIYLRNARNLIVKQNEFANVSTTWIGPCQNCEWRQNLYHQSYSGNWISLNFSGETRSWTFGEGFVLDGNIFRDVCRMAVELFSNLRAPRITNNRLESWNETTQTCIDYGGVRFGFSLVGGGANQALVAGNYAYGPLSRPIGFEIGWSHSTWANNEVDGFDKAFVVQGQQGNVITGNRIYNSNTGIYFSNAAGGNNQNTIVENNLIVDTVTAAITMIPNYYGGSVFRNNTILRQSSKPDDGVTTWRCFKLDAPDSPVTFENNSCELRVSGLSAYWGFAVYGYMGASRFIGNSVKTCGVGPFGTGFRLSATTHLSGATVSNHHSENLNYETTGTSGLGSASGNTYYNVANRDPNLGSVSGAARCTP